MALGESLQQAYHVNPTADMLAAQHGQVPVTPLHALIATAHQANAALMVSVAVLLAAWTWRLRRPLPGGS